MKSALYLLLVMTLAIVAAACERNNAPDKTVSANSDKTATRLPEKRPAAPVITSGTVPSGTPVRVTLAGMISTESNKRGDTFVGNLSEAIVVNGKVLAQKEDRVRGHLTKVDEPRRVKGRARLEMVLDEIETGGKMYKVGTEPFVAVASDNHKRDATEIAGGAAVGAAVGALAGGKKGAALGAIIGGGTGTTAVLLTQGDQLELPTETQVNFVLSREVNLPVIGNESR